MIFIQRIRKNDVIRDAGKQFELGKAFMDIHKWTEGEHPITITYRSIPPNNVFDETVIKTSMKVRSNERGGDRVGADCKEYANSIGGTPALKTFLVKSLGLTLQDVSGFFILCDSKNDSKNFDLYVVRAKNSQTILNNCERICKMCGSIIDERIALRGKTMIDWLSGK